MMEDRSATVWSAVSTPKSMACNAIAYAATSPTTLRKRNAMRAFSRRKPENVQAPSQG
jgi:hypothetical protein